MKVPPIYIIAAVDECWGIGRANQLLCSIPADMRRFKALTCGGTVIMGHNTWRSLPVKPLSERRNIVLTRGAAVEAGGCEVAHSRAEAVALLNANERTFVIGGAELYRDFLGEARALFLTKIHATFPADRFFPKLNADDWRIITEEFVPHNAVTPYDCTFQTLIPKVAEFHFPADCADFFKIL